MNSTLLRWVYDHKISLLACVLCVALSVPLLARWLTSGGAAQLRFSAGPSFTRRAAVAEYLRKQALANGLAIEMIENDGSETSLELIKRGELDIALVSSGVVVPHDEDIRVLGATQLEAVHVLVRKELVGQGQLVSAIRGKRVNIGVRGSTEWLLSREFLTFARIQLPSPTHPGDVIPTELSKRQLHDRASAILQAEGAQKEALLAELPDCVLVLATLPSLEVQSLVEAANYQVVSLPATRAFLLDNMQDSNSPSTIIERQFLEPTVIPNNSYFAKDAFPATDCETVGVRLLIVAHKNTPAKCIRPLMKTLFEGEFSRRILPLSPRELPTPYAIHSAAVAYLDRDRPLLTGEVMESLSTALSIFGAFSAGVFTLYGLLGRKQKREPTDYYAEIRKLDQLARSAQSDAPTQLLPQDLAKYLSDRLLKLRQDFIEDICEGRIEGDQVISNVLGLLKDSRQHLINQYRDTPASLPISTPSPVPRPPTPLRRAG